MLPQVSPIVKIITFFIICILGLLLLAHMAFGETLRIKSPDGLHSITAFDRPCPSGQANFHLAQYDGPSGSIMGCWHDMNNGYLFFAFDDGDMYFFEKSAFDPIAL